MLPLTWIEKHQAAWRRLEALLEQVDHGGLGRLSTAELSDLGLLYRQVSSDLARLRADPAGARYAAMLNQLLARAHNRIYGRPPARAAALWAFYRDEYPALFRAHADCLALSAAVLVLAALGGWAAVIRDPAFARHYLSAEMLDTIARHKMWTDSVVAVRPLASSGIMTNNLTVAFTAFALGITAGIGTLYMMFTNGLLLGVVGAACYQAGMSLKLWSFVAPHGVLELPAICIAGAAGLRLAQGWLFPGCYTRRESLRRGAREAVRLAVGTIPLLITAGVIEAFISPTALPIPLKFAFATAVAALFASYLAGLTAHRPADPAATWD